MGPYAWLQSCAGARAATTGQLLRLKAEHFFPQTGSVHSSMGGSLGGREGGVGGHQERVKSNLPFHVCHRGATLRTWKVGSWVGYAEVVAGCLRAVVKTTRFTSSKKHVC